MISQGLSLLNSRAMSQPPGVECRGVGRRRRHHGAVVPEVWAVCLLILLRVVAEVAAAARITGFFLVLLAFFLDPRGAANLVDDCYPSVATPSIHVH